MKARNIISLFSAGIIIGFTVGLINGLICIIANRYIQYRMFRLSAVTLQRSLNKYLMWALVISFGLIIIGLALSLIWRLVTNIIELNIKSKYKIRNKIVSISSWKYTKRMALVLIVLLLFLNIGVLIDKKLNVPKGPNVIILLIDALRRDHVGIYGYDRETTPEIDKFSQEASIFKDTISQSCWTGCSVASLFSALYPSVNGLISYTEEGEAKRIDVLNYKIATVTEVLKDKGYTTGAFLANGMLIKKFQWLQGWDVFDRIKKKVRPIAPELNEAALKWIKKNKDKPFFAYVHYMDVHGTYNPPEPYDSFFEPGGFRQLSIEEYAELRQCAARGKTNPNLNYYIALYDGCIRYTDYHIGQFFERLKEYGVFDSSIIIVTADHGEAFFEHGRSEHGRNLYYEEIDVPLIIKFPEPVNVPDTTQHKVELIDVVPTIFDVLNYDFPYDVNGGNLFEKIKTKHTVFSEQLTKYRVQDRLPKIAMIKDDFKAIYMVKEKRLTELYDIEKDRLETNNIIDLYPDKAMEFEKEIELQLEEWARQNKALGLVQTSGVIKDQATIDELKALGYLQ